MHSFPLVGAHTPNCIEKPVEFFFLFAPTLDHRADFSVS
jgi:hypothetical protein